MGAEKDLESGVYKISLIDKIMFNLDRKQFWMSIIKETGYSETEFHSIRAKFGYTNDKLEGQKIFIPSKQGTAKIYIAISSDANKTKFNDKANEISQLMALHANFLGASIKKLMITSTKRSPEKQAELMVPYLKNKNSTLYPTVRKWLYIDKQEDGYSYLEKIENNLISEEEFANIAKNLALKHVTANKNDYAHVLNDNIMVFDIGPNGSGHSSSDIAYFNITIDLLKGKDLDSKSKKHGEGGEEAYHIILR